MSGRGTSLQEFRKVEWLEGRWRGTGGGSFGAFPAFYEEYEMRDDSTMVLRVFADSTFSETNDSTIVLLRDGRMMSRPSRGTAVAVQRVTGDSIVFDSSPETLFLRITDDRWRAIFATPSGAPERYFEMHRIPDRIRVRHGHDRP